MRGSARSWLACAALLVGVGSGCSGQSNPTPPLGSLASTAAGVSSGSVPRGPYPRGQVDPQNVPDPATQGPKIEVVSPERGAQTAQADVTIQVRVTDPNGVGAVEIDGLTATSAGQDLYEASLTLAAGMNLVRVSATDALGNVSTGTFSLVHGQFVAPDTLLERSIGAGFSPAGLQRMARILDPLVAKLDLESAILKHNPLISKASFVVRSKALRHDPARIDVAGEPGAGVITLYLDHAELELDVDLIGLSLTQATIFADTAAVDFHVMPVDPATLAAGTATALDCLVIQRTEVRFTNFRVQASSGLINSLIGNFTGQVEDAVRNKLVTLLPGAIYNLIDNPGVPGFDRPLSVALPSIASLAPILSSTQPSSLDLLFRIQDTDGSATAGLGVSLGVQAVANPPAYPTTAQQVLVGGAQGVPTVLAGDHFAAALSQDAVNLLLYALWQSGGVRLGIDGTKPLSPGSAMSLNVKMLYPFIKAVRDLAPDPDTPLAIEVSSVTPPIALLGHKGTLIEVLAGETEIKLSIDYMDGQPPLELFTLRIPLQLAADVTITGGNKIKISGLQAPIVGIDMIREPVVDLADQEIENFLNQILPWMLDQYKMQLPEIPIPALPFGLNLTNPRTEVLPGMLVIRGSL